MKKMLLILLVLVMLTSLFAPLAAADDGAPSRADMRGHGEIAVPKKDSWLPAYETRYVCSSGGVAAFLFKAPKLKDKLIIGNVLEGTELTLLAKETDTKNKVDFYLVKMAPNRLGWICVGQTAEDTALLDSVPELSEGSWIYSRGEGDANRFAVQFGEKRRATLLRVSDGARIGSGWILSERRVFLDNKYFIWDGEQFVSRDEYKSAEGRIRYTITRDTEGLYDKLAG